MLRNTKQNILPKLKIICLRILSIIFVPIISLISKDTKNNMYYLFPNEISRILTIIIILILMFAWYLFFQKMIYKIKNDL